MDEETARRAIEPFFSTKGVGRGTGLGLSMAHGLAAQLGGALTIESKPGEGTAICLWLPESTQPALQYQPSGLASQTRCAGGVVLLVDDEDLVRQSAAQMLTDLGYDVRTAASAGEAKGLIDNGLRFDLLITDHLMPGMTGTQLAREVGSKLPDLNVLIISGYADAEGIDPDLPRLTKPFRQADLAAALLRLR